MTAPPRPVVLVAASGLAREAMATIARTGCFAVVGVLDDDPDLRGTAIGAVSVIGGIADAGRFPDVQFVVCAGRGTVRERIVQRLAALGVGADRYATVIDPSAVVPAGCRVGAGSIVLAQATLTAAVSLGRHVVLMPQVVLTHDDRVGDYATICAGVVVGGDVQIGSGAYLGMNASVRQKVRVGEGATLGMGSVLLTDLPDGRTWAGVPAREIPSRGAGDSDRQQNREPAGPVGPQEEEMAS